MLQSKLGSLYEALMNILIGYAIASAANYLVLPLWLDGVTVGNSLAIGLVFTAISLGRQYVIRRWFNHRLHLAAQKLAGVKGKWKYKGHGHNYSVYECPNCKEEIEW